ncbi:MAG TPA: TonB-dependent receptor [Rhodothermales bacterium]|nr:TonB-dependent receptor [Rhodothermales bacterium]
MKRLPMGTMTMLKGRKGTRKKGELHFFHPIALVLLSLFAATPALAQVDTTDTVLPDIAPREVEILGTLEVSFPALRRQPLVGFNPPPRVPNVPAGRRPFVESYGDASAGLPSSPLQRPEPPATLSGATYPPAQGEIDILGGRYYSRAVQGYITTPIGEGTALLTRFDYEGSDGHQPFESSATEEEENRARFDAAEGQIAMWHTGSSLAIGVGADGFYETFDMYGAELGPNADVASLRDQPLRKGIGGGGRIQLRTVGNAATSGQVSLRLGGAQYETSFYDDDTDAASLLEQRIDLDGTIRHAMSSGDIWANTKLSTARLADDFGSTSAVDAGAGFRFQVGRTLTLSVGGRFLGAFSDTDQPRDEAESKQVGYASPDILIELVPSPGVRFYAQNKPGVEANALSEVFRDNPYLTAQPQLRPTLRSIDAEVGTNLFVGPVQFNLRGGYQDMPQYLFYEHILEANYDRGFSALRYSEAQIYHAGGSLSAMLPGGFYAMLGLTYRDGRLPNDDTDIPYFAPVVGEATLSYSFSQSRGLVQLTGNFENTRFRDRAETEELNAFVDLDLSASYNITRIVGVVARVENIGGQENARWDHYPEPPFVIAAGLRVFW